MIRNAERFDSLRLFGAIALTIAVFLVDMRQQDEWGALLRLVVALVPCAALYSIVLAVATPGDALRRWQTALMLCAVALLLLTLIQLADLLGAGSAESSGTLFWVMGLIAAKAGYVAYIVRSPIHVLIATIAAAISFLSFVDWAIDDLSLDSTRDLLLLVALVYCAVAYRLRTRLGEPGADYVNYVVLAAALVAVLSGTIGVGTGSLGGVLAGVFFQENSTFWEVVLLCVSLIAVGYTVVTGYRATAYVGLTGIVVFVSVVAVEGGIWAWPLLLALGGIAAVVASIAAPRLRDRSPAKSQDG